MVVYGPPSSSMYLNDATVTTNLLLLPRSGEPIHPLWSYHPYILYRCFIIIIINIIPYYTRTAYGFFTLKFNSIQPHDRRRTALLVFETYSKNRKKLIECTLVCVRTVYDVKKRLTIYHPYLPNSGLYRGLFRVSYACTVGGTLECSTCALTIRLLRGCTQSSRYAQLVRKENKMVRMGISHAFLNTNWTDLRF